MNNYIPDTSSTSQTTALMKVHEGIKHTEISEEFILPDYLPDIKRIIRADARPKIDGKFITSGKIDYEGDVVCHILFCDENNLLKTVTFTAAFSDSIELDHQDDECIANLIPSPQSLNCRMLNPRRVSLRLRIDTNCTVWCNRSFQPETVGDLSPYTPEVLTKDIDVLKLICSGESGLNTSADLEVDGALPQIGNVISCNVDMSFYECKGADGKVLCRGDMPITLFYSTPSQQNDGESPTENYTVLYRKLPIAQVVGAEGIDDSYECIARGSIDDVKVSVAENGFGERRILEIDITYRIYLNCVSRDKVTVTKDIYLIDRNVKTETESKEFCRLSRNYSTNFGCNSVTPRIELNLNDADNIFEVSSHPEVRKVEFSEDKHRLIVTGESSTSAIISGSDGLYSADYNIPFKVELDASGIPENFIFNSDTVCMSAKGRIDADNLYTDLELQLNLMILGVEQIEILKKAEFFEKTEAENSPQMRFFYPSENETIWDIGKRFGISLDELRSSNTIVNDELPSLIMIPCSKNK